jgi:membrane protease YdiL (CAAX protease family)
MSALKSLIRNLPVPVEFVIVVSLWLDPLLLNGSFLLRKFIHSGVWEVDNAFLIRGALFTVAAFGVLVWIGNLRGWPLSKLGVRISWVGTGGGILLAVVSYAVSYMVWTKSAVIIHSLHPKVIVAALAVPVVVLSQIINSVFEEVVEAGYFVHTFSRFGMWPAILVSASLRTLYHVPWVGIAGLLGIFLSALIFAFVYWRWRQLWPLVLAHLLRNFYFLLFAVHHAA